MNINSKNKISARYPVLIVDDDVDSTKYFETVLKKGGISKIESCNDSTKISKYISDDKIELILLDLNMPVISGETILQLISNKHSDIPVIIITGENNVNKAVECLKLGAADYIVKPINRSQLLNSVIKAIQLRELKIENLFLKQQVLTDNLINPTVFEKIITKNKKMHSIFKYVEAIANSTQSILITGDTGVGKELIARAIHDHSNVTGNFTPVNVAGLDDNTFSDTLFGHKKGAFTGATHNRDGLIIKAEKGTLFLDEIGDLSHLSQVKLLRLLQEKEFFPLGSDTPVSSDTRVVVATNKDINDIENNVNFRKDLYYRLCIHHIHIPPLKERLEDIPILLHFFNKEISKELNQKEAEIDTKLISFLKTYDFPGNIREFYGIMFDAVSRFSGKTITVDNIKEIIIKKNKSFKDTINNIKTEEKEANQTTKTIFPEKLPTLKKVEEELISEALKRSTSQSKAAIALGISRQALNKRLKINKLKNL